MKRRTRKIIFFTSLAVVAVLVTVLIVILVIPKDGGLKIRNLAKYDTSEPVIKSDYSKSRLYLHKNGTFDVTIILIDDDWFVAHGTYEFRDGKYWFTYHDAWMYELNGLDQDPDGLFITGEAIDYEYQRKGKDKGIKFIDHRKMIYYFA